MEGKPSSDYLKEKRESKRSSMERRQSSDELLREHIFSLRVDPRIL